MKVEGAPHGVIWTHAEEVASHIDKCLLREGAAKQHRRLLIFTLFYQDPNAVEFWKISKHRHNVKAIGDMSDT